MGSGSWCLRKGKTKSLFRIKESTTLSAQRPVLKGSERDTTVENLGGGKSNWVSIYMSNLYTREVRVLRIQPGWWKAYLASLGHWVQSTALYKPGGTSFW